MTTVTVDDAGYITDIDGDLPDEPRAIVVREPDRLAVSRTPEEMVDLATRMANALADIVEKRKLYAVIQGRKFPQVEAWMTIGRMDNVVAREASVPVRHDDGSYEAMVELVRLSDGMVIGRASALCGSPDDAPWGGTPPKWGKDGLPARPEHQRRSMAVTRATSRAFRQQYSWIMALAGYEPTPADEMPGQDAPAEPTPGPDPTGEVEELLGIQTREGTVRVSPASSGAPTKLDVRQAPDGPWFGFALETAKGNLPQVFVEGDLATAILTVTPDPLSLKGQWCRVGGKVYAVRQAGRATFHRMKVDAFETTDYKFPAPAATEVQPSGQAHAGTNTADDAELDLALELVP